MHCNVRVVSKAGGEAAGNAVLTVLTKASEARPLANTVEQPCCAISSFQPHREWMHESPNRNDLAEVTLHPLRMRGCVVAYHAES